MISGLRILFLEDDASLRESFQGIFGVYNTVQGAPSVLDGLKKLDRELDVVLLDKGLSDGSGLELIPYIRSKAPKAAIIVVTGDKDFHSVAKWLQAGADDYLLKTNEFMQDVLVRIPVAIAHVQSRRASLAPDSTHPLPEKLQTVTPEDFNQFRGDQERAYIERVLRLCNGNTALTCKHLGIGRSTLFKKMQELEISRVNSAVTQGGQQ